MYIYDRANVSRNSWESNKVEEKQKQSVSMNIFIFDSSKFLPKFNRSSQSEMNNR